MEYELEVFEVHDDGDNVESGSSKKHLKHNRKKCKHKSSIVNIGTVDSDLHRSKTSVVSSDCPRRPQSLRESILSVFSKLVVWRDQRRYQTTVPDKADSPHSSKEYYKNFYTCGECAIVNKSSVNIFHLLFSCIYEQH